MSKSTRTLAAAAAALATLTSCATARDSVLVGATTGAAAGGLVANQASDHNPTSTAIGAAVGALTGGLLGYLGHKDLRRKEEERKLRLNSNQGKPQYPTLSSPEVRAVWVPAHIENDTYIDGHYLYKIDRNATWRKED